MREPTVKQDIVTHIKIFLAGVEEDA